MQIIKTETTFLHRTGRPGREYRIHCDVHADGMMSVRTACGRIGNVKAEAVRVRHDLPFVALDAIAKIKNRAQANGYWIVGQLKKTYAGPAQADVTPSTPRASCTDSFVPADQAALIAALAARGVARKRAFSVAL